MSPQMKSLGFDSAVVAEIRDVSISQSDPELEKLKEDAAAKIMQMGEEEIESNRILQSYRNMVKKTGRSAKNFPPAAESLIRLVKFRGRFPPINAAVDAYNLISAKYFLALGVHDIDKLEGPITFRLSEGNEPFTAVGSDKRKMTAKGDYLYSDSKQVLAWLDSKDSDAVKLSTDTKNILVVIMGTDATPIDYNLSAAKEACEIIAKFNKGTYEISMVG
jgi:DNA/RNA-binding domain of Phe-tRNA-synthetase-like protein